MAASTYPRILLRGTYAEYQALVSKNPDALYFCTDNGKLYLGTTDFTDSLVTVNADPTTSNAVPGKIYYNSTSGAFLTLEGTGADATIRTISYRRVTSISSDLSSEDGTVPSTYAVKLYVDETATGSGLVKSVRQKTTTVESQTVPVRGTIQYVTGDDTPHDVEMTGVVTKPTYDASSRTFTFPVTGESDVVVELGKDIFIDPQGDNRYENGFIYLYLNDGTQSEDPTEIAIPVTGLVTDYFGDDTDSISVDIDNNTHKVTAEAILKPDIVTPGSEWTNALKVSSTAGAKGLYVDLSDIEGSLANLAASTTAWGDFNGDPET